MIRCDQISKSRATRPLSNWRLRFELLEDRRLLTIVLTDNVLLGSSIASISPSGSGAREDPYVYDFAGQDLNMAEFDILGTGTSFRFENLGMDGGGHSIRHSGDGGDIDVSNDSGYGGCVSIVGAEGAIELSGILTIGESGGSVTIDDGAMGPAGPIRIAQGIDTSSFAESLPDSSGRASVRLHGHSVEVLGSIRTASNGLDAGHVTILGLAGINVEGETIVTEGARRAGDIEIRGFGNVQLHGAGGISVNTRGYGGDVVIVADAVALEGDIDTSSGGGPTGSGAVQLEGRTITLRGNILTAGHLTSGGSVTILGGEQIDIEADTIVTGGTPLGGAVEIRGPGSLRLDGVDGVSVDTRGSSSGGSVTFAVDTVLLAGNIDTSAGGYHGGSIQLDGNIIELSGNIITSCIHGESGAVAISALDRVDIRGDTILAVTGVGNGGGVSISGPGSVRLDGMDLHGMSVNASVAAGNSRPIHFAVDTLILAGGIDASASSLSGSIRIEGDTVAVNGLTTTQSFNADGGDVLINVDGPVTLGGGIETRGVYFRGLVHLEAGEDVLLGMLDMDLVGATHISAGGNSFVDGDLLNFNTFGEPQLQLDSPGAVFYDPTVPANNYLNALWYPLRSGGVLRPLNVPPEANAGGPYTIAEGDPLTLDASGSVDADGDTLTYRWDVDGDGDFDESVHSASPILSWTQLTALGIDDDVEQRELYLEVSDGLSSTVASAILTVSNAVPTLRLGAVETIYENDSAMLPGTLIDPGTADTHTLIVDWGDPNSSAASMFALPTVTNLTEGDMISSSTDGAVLLIASVDRTTGRIEWAVSHRYLDDGDAPGNGTESDTSSIVVTVRDDDSGETAETASIVVNNVAPTIGGAVLSQLSIEEGDTVVVTGTFDDPALGIDTFTGTALWSDGVSTPLTLDGYSGTFSTERHFPDDDPTGTPLDVFSVEITIRDDDTGSDSATSPELTVQNVDPIVSFVANSAQACGDAGEQEAVTVSAEWVEPGLPDTFTARIEWGDGNENTYSYAPGTRSLAENHTYQHGGVFPITVRLTDDDTGQAVATSTAYVIGVGVVGNRLYVIGTPGADEVLVHPNGSDQLTVQASFLPERQRVLSASGVEQIVMLLCDGDDLAGVAGSISLPVQIQGGGGNDRLNGGGGLNILLGGSGNDCLVGGSSHDLLIGGAGADTLQANGGGDIVIAGTTAYDGSVLPAINTLFALLEDFADDGWLEDEHALDETTVFDDDDVDELLGVNNTDRLFYKLGRDKVRGNR